MLTQLRFQNFKSWRDTGEIRIAPITGIFGTNSSGKTAILQFLLMLKQTVETLDSQRILHLGDDRTYINLGTSHDIAHRHQLPANIIYLLRWDLYLADIHLFLEASISSLAATIGNMLHTSKTTPLNRYNGSLQYQATVHLDMKGMNIQEFLYGYLTGDEDRFDWTNIGLRSSISGSGENQYQLITEGDLLQQLSSTFIALSLEQPIKSYRFPSDVRLKALARNTITSLERGYEKLFQQLFYLGPLRDYPRRLYLWSGEKPQDVGKRGELAVAALLGSRNDNPELEQKVAYWLKELGLIHSFRVQTIAEHRQDYEVLVQCAPHAPEVLITDVGFGVSQVLPVLVLCYYVPKGSVVLLEQPEIHLHPSVQAKLADVLIDAIETRQIRIIVESHSEHLLHRLQRRIAEETIAVDDAALYFCRMDETGESHLETLQLDPYGNITNWPPNFFGDDMEDLVKMTEAAMRRQGAVVED